MIQNTNKGTVNILQPLQSTQQQTTTYKQQPQQITYTLNVQLRPVSMYTKLRFFTNGFDHIANEYPVSLNNDRFVLIFKYFEHDKQ